MNYWAKNDLVVLSDYSWHRTHERLEGLSDAEYLWEPVPGCWTVRRGPTGAMRGDHALPNPDPAPFTTIAWRLCHLIECYGADRNASWLGVSLQGKPVDPAATPAPATADEAISALQQAHDRWRAHLISVPDETLGEPIGPVGGRYGSDTRGAFALHMLDEFIHHGAEVALLRDLYRATNPADAADPTVAGVLAGDTAALAMLRDDPSLRTRVQSDHPDLVTRAAAAGRWDVVTDLVGLGFDVGASGTSAVHYAAGTGDVDLVQLLIDNGADLTQADPEYGATPLGWAQFFGRDDVVRLLSLA
jgi:hypothetical protein